MTVILRTVILINIHPLIRHLYTFVRMPTLSLWILCYSRVISACQTVNSTGDQTLTFARELGEANKHDFMLCFTLMLMASLLRAQPHMRISAWAA